MATIEWFAGWAKRHMERHPRTDWAERKPEFWRTLHDLMAEKGITLAEAEAASKEMAKAWPVFMTGHTMAFLGALARVHASSEVEMRKDPLSETRASARESMAETRAMEALWLELPESERAEIEAEVTAARPWLRRRPVTMHAFCLAAMCDRATV